MACLSPLTAFYSKELNPSGKRSLVFDARASHSGVKIQIACGQCIECRLQYSLNWAVRCMNEASSHEVNSFITCTYSDKKLPEDGSLYYRDFQLFMKRLRKESDFKFKFYMCGEYGETTNRPHYHALLFGCDFSDREFYSTSRSGEKLYTSELLEGLWQNGFCTVGDVTFESAAYVARYVTKKVTGDKAADHYMGRVPEFCHMSNGIGASWLAAHGKYTFDHDHVIINGKRAKVPRYYDKSYELVDASKVEAVKKLRVSKARVRAAELKARVEENGAFNTFSTKNKVRRARLALARREI